MARSLNRAEIIGNLTADPEIRTFANGGKVANFTVATSEKWKDRATGEEREDAEFHRIAVTADGLAGVCEKYLRKGSKVYVEGQLKTRKWQDRDGNDRYTTDVQVRPYGGQVILLGEPRGGAPAGRGGADQPPAARDYDDEIPF